MNVDKFLTRIIIGKGKPVKCHRWTVDDIGTDGMRDCALSIDGLTLEDTLKIAETATMIDETPDYIVYKDASGWLRIRGKK